MHAIVRGNVSAYVEAGDLTEITEDSAGTADISDEIPEEVLAHEQA